MDGYFWVADTGSAIVGDHFDLFVGDEALYKDFTSRKFKDRYKTTIYTLPKLPPPGEGEAPSDPLSRQEP